MRAVVIGLALVGLASWGSHQLDPQHGLDIPAMVRAETARHAGLSVGTCLREHGGYRVVACTDTDATLRAVRAIARRDGGDCPQPQTTTLIRERSGRTGLDTYWCVAKVANGTGRQR